MIIVNNTSYVTIAITSSCEEKPPTVKQNTLVNTYHKGDFLSNFIEEIINYPLI